MNCSLHNQQVVRQEWKELVQMLQRRRLRDGEGLTKVDWALELSHRMDDDAIMIQLCHVIPHDLCFWVDPGSSWYHKPYFILKDKSVFRIVSFMCSFVKIHWLHLGLHAFVWMAVGLRECISETNWLSPTSYQLPMHVQREIRLHEFFFHPNWDFGWLVCMQLLRIQM